MKKFVQQPDVPLARLVLSTRTAKRFTRYLLLMIILSLIAIYLCAISPYFEPQNQPNSAVVSVISDPENKARLEYMELGIKHYNDLIKQHNAAVPAESLDEMRAQATQLINRTFYAQFGYGPGPFSVLKILVTMDVRAAKNMGRLELRPFDVLPDQLLPHYSYAVLLDYRALILILFINAILTIILLAVQRSRVPSQKQQFEEAILDSYFNVEKEVKIRPQEVGGNTAILICTAVDLETEAVLSYLKDVQQEMIENAHYSRGIFTAEHGQNITIYVRQLGKGNAIGMGESVLAFRSLSNIQLAFFVGTAGGIKDVDVGDVVIAQRIYNYEEGKYENGGLFKPRPNAEKPSRKLVEAAKLVRATDNWKKILPLAAQGQFKTIVDTIITGEKVIADIGNPTYGIIKNHYSGAVALDMEGQGFLGAAYLNGVSALVIRGISDQLSNKDSEKDKLQQPMASQRAAGFAFALITSLSSSS